MKKFTQLFTAISLILLSLSAYAQDSGNALLKGFNTPPESAKPRVWWHWMNGNITTDGIAKDLKWMKRVGIGGFQNFDANLSTPQIVQKRLVYMTPEWKDAFRFTAKLADSLKLEMAIAGSPGWSESGGPWVPAEDGMKKIVWTETPVQGGIPFSGSLPKPSSASGTFQNLSTNAPFGINHILPEYYHDISVIAYRLPETDISLSKLKPTVTSSGGNFTLAQLTDGDVAKSILLPSDKTNGSAWIQFEFTTPQTIKAITLVTGSQNRHLEVSDDGTNFRNVCDLPMGRAPEQTFTIPVTTAKYFRVVFRNPTPPKLGTDVAEINLHTAFRINNFEEKAAFAAIQNAKPLATPATTDAIPIADVVDLTGKMKEDGTLDWTPTAGNWNVIRFGYSLTGRPNHPASPEATGLEVDKLNPKAVKAYFENYLDQYKNATGGLMGKNGGLQCVITDSWEAGVQNWTNDMMQEFASRRGYSMLPWMPVLTGHIVKSTEESEHFLWDFRETLSDLVAEYHYDLLTKLLHERGMKRYSESHESGRAFIGDGMEVKRTADIPMSALWTPKKGVYNNDYKADIRESASVAHIYGQNLVAAESMTAYGDTWAFYPERLKPTADLELASGLNRFVIHTSVHQPTDDKIPGLGLGPYGQWFTRHETWAELAKPWTTYLSRSCYMLQQGKFVADVIYYYGEDNNITALFRSQLPDVPAGYNFDFVNADALLNMLSVSDNQIVTKSGMHYKVLALDTNSMLMRLPVARKISDMVKAGAIVVGPKPTGSPSLSDDKAEFDAIVNELWGENNTVKSVGKGKVYTGQSIKNVLEALNIKPDFEYTRPQGNTELLYVHRELPDQDIYWVNNRNDRVENVEATFRIAGRKVEIWHPETGRIEPASYSFENGVTKVPLHLQPSDAIFVVFRDKAVKTALTVPQPKETQLMTVEGSWNVQFQKDRGAPDKIVLDKLASWSDNANAGVKYFSGTGTYTKKINAAAGWFKKGNQLWLDLGDVKNLAEVTVNGKYLGIIWKKPFRVNVTGALKPGENNLTVNVTDLWVNRLIGDMQPGIDKKYTYTTMEFYQANSPLLPSGLIGPVNIVSER
ncbi:MAG: glycosyl hydrolase [Bacteroidota bacterium]|nr:glycosyl hydrolase [Bacteroidota bacterium]